MKTSVIHQQWVMLLTCHNPCCSMACSPCQESPFYHPKAVCICSIVDSHGGIGHHQPSMQHDYLKFEILPSIELTLKFSFFINDVHGKTDSYHVVIVNISHYKMPMMLTIFMTMADMTVMRDAWQPCHLFMTIYDSEICVTSTVVWEWIAIWHMVVIV